MLPSAGDDLPAAKQSCNKARPCAGSAAELQRSPSLQEPAACAECDKAWWPGGRSYVGAHWQWLDDDKELLPSTGTAGHIWLTLISPAVGCLQTCGARPTWHSRVTHTRKTALHCVFGARPTGHSTVTHAHKTALRCAFQTPLPWNSPPLFPSCIPAFNRYLAKC